MEIKIHRIDRSLPLPKYQTKGSFAFDFLSRKEVTISPQSLSLIPTNLIIESPKDLALLVLPRSSTFKKKSLIFPHSIGLIDQDYCGEHDEIFIQVLNYSGQDVIIDRGERIAQGLFVKTTSIEFIESLHHYSEKKSRGGFGSTG